MDERAVKIEITLTQADGQLHLEMTSDGPANLATHEVIGILEMAKIQYIEDRYRGVR